MKKFLFMSKVNNQRVLKIQNSSSSACCIWGNFWNSFHLFLLSGDVLFENHVLCALVVLRGGWMCLGVLGRKIIVSYISSYIWGDILLKLHLKFFIWYLVLSDETNFFKIISSKIKILSNFISFNWGTKNNNIKKINIILFHEDK